MYILCKEDFTKVLFNFKKELKYPITNITEGSCYFEYPKGRKGIRDCISIAYLEENKDFIEIKNETVCNHSVDKQEKIWNLIICSECQELIEILEKN